jgi:hypothetical protein
VVRITDNDAGSITALNYLGSDGLNWKTGQSLTLYRTTARRANFSTTAGLSYVRWNGIETQRKVNLYISEPVPSTSVVAGLQPLQIMKRTARSFFYGSATVPGTAQETWPAGWFMEAGGGLCTDFGQSGTPAQPITAASGEQVILISDGDDDDPWLMVRYTVSDGSLASDSPHMYYYFTLVYGDYQESDPVAQVCMAAADTAHTPGAVFAFSINSAKMHKEVVGINIYEAKVTNTLLTALGHLSLQDSSYLNYSYMAFNRLTDNSLTGPFSALVPGERGGMLWTNSAYGDAGDLSNIHNNLARAIDKNRSVLTPRYVAMGGRQQGSVVAVDESDSILRISCYDGSGAHNDDNFPNVSTDNAGVKLRVQLSVHGELLGLGMVNNMLVALKAKEIEVIDLQSGNTNIIPADVLSRNSILTTPYGLVWAGESAIYIMRLDGSLPGVLNESWVNFYDGTLVNASGNQYVTRDYRALVLMGYDPTYRSIWAHVPCTQETGANVEYLCFRHYVQEGIVDVRKLAIGSGGAANNSVKNFAQKAGQLVIVHNSGMLNYPNRTGAFPWQDSVTSADAAGNGIETSQKLHLGSIYTISQNFVVEDILLDFAGSSASSRKFNLNFYANRETSAFEQKSFAIDSKMPRVGMPPRGALQRLLVETALPSTNLADFKDWTISTMSLNVSPLMIPGNR